MHRQILCRVISLDGARKSSGKSLAGQSGTVNLVNAHQSKRLIGDDFYEQSSCF